jgi:hypothetical protein
MGYDCSCNSWVPFHVEVVDEKVLVAEGMS